MKTLFAFIAGLLTTLSPCVLPVLPFVTTTSLNKNRFGPVFLGLGLLVSFVGVSILVSSTGYLLGIDTAVGRKIAGLLLTGSGALLFFPALMDRVSERLSFLSNIGNQSLQRFDSRSLLAELVTGVLLGIVWTPCSGPSLGAALGLASREGSVAQSSLILLVFGLGSIVPLMAVAYGARNLISRLKKGSGAILTLKKVFGLAITLFGILIVTDQDRAVETWLTNATPDGWLKFITRY